MDQNQGFWTKTPSGAYRRARRALRWGSLFGAGTLLAARDGPFAFVWQGIQETSQSSGSAALMRRT
jgi:hypothetical protein